MKKIFPQKDHLDMMALDIEFLLISVIQGVALGVLASASVKPLTDLQFLVWPYIVTAFLFIIIFWSGAIIHAVSFIDWPIDLTHTFLYFLVSLNEILVIINLAEPRLWFSFLMSFQILAIILYIYDLRIIKEHEKTFSVTTNGKALYDHIISEQKKELYIFLPTSFLFNLIVVLCLFIYPETFLFKNYHLIFIFLQMIFGIVFLKHALGSFKKRSFLLRELM